MKLYLPQSLCQQLLLPPVLDRPDRNEQWKSMKHSFQTCWDLPSHIDNFKQFVFTLSFSGMGALCQPPLPQLGYIDMNGLPARSTWWPKLHKQGLYSRATGNNSPLNEDYFYLYLLRYDRKPGERCVLQLLNSAICLILILILLLQLWSLIKYASHQICYESDIPGCMLI